MSVYVSVLHTSELRIVRWSVEEEHGWLKIVVRDLHGLVDLTIYRAYRSKPNDSTTLAPWQMRTGGEWAWQSWSMAGKPTVKTTIELAELLDALVLADPVLKALAPSYGISGGYAEGTPA